MKYADVADIFDRHVGVACPGAAVEVRRHGDVLFRRTGGFTGIVSRDLDIAGFSPAPISENTRFDLASLTKPLVTALLTAILTERGMLSLDTVIGQMPGCTGCPDKQNLSIRSILLHNAGFVAWLPIAEQLTSTWGNVVAGTPEARQACFSEVLEWPLAPSVGTGHAFCYSDVGYILIGMLLERLSGLSLSRLFSELVVGPLGLCRTGFMPVFAATGQIPSARSVNDIAATAWCPIRQRVVCAEVHDNNAWVLGGAAGHAGLFSTVSETADLVDVWIDAVAGRCKILGRQTAEAFVYGDVTSPVGMPAGPGVVCRTPGFDRPSFTGSMAGDLAPAGTVGHLGFTGTAFWFDRATGVQIVLLTNRVNPDMYGRQAEIRTMRREIYDAVWKTL